LIEDHADMIEPAPNSSISEPETPHATTGVAVVDSAHRFTFVNLALCEMLRRSPDELIGRRFDEFTHPDDIELDAHLARRVFSGKLESYQVEKRFVAKDGRVVPVHLTATVVRDRNGSGTFGVAIVRRREAGYAGWIGQRDSTTVPMSGPSDMDRIRNAILGG
jgi:PAS domain S-box-containing protein